MQSSDHNAKDLHSVSAGAHHERKTLALGVVGESAQIEHDKARGRVSAADAKFISDGRRRAAAAARVEAASAAGAGEVDSRRVAAAHPACIQSAAAATLAGAVQRGGPLDGCSAACSPVAHHSCTPRSLKFSPPALLPLRPLAAFDLLLPKLISFLRTLLNFMEEVRCRSCWVQRL